MLDELIRSVVVERLEAYKQLSAAESKPAESSEAAPQEWFPTF